MRFLDSIFAKLLKPVDRRAFKKIVDRHRGDAYDKTFKSWDHLVTLVYAQLSGINGLRALEIGFNANCHHHCHLGTGKLARTTLSDANARRPAAIFAESFVRLAAIADRQTRQEGAAMVELIDSSPVPFGEVCKWATWNGRIRGMKLHVVYDPQADVPRSVEITPANVNDVEIGRRTPIKAGTTYVFDKGYCRFDWWRSINDCGAYFVTRAKVNMRLRAVRHRTCANVRATASSSSPTTKSSSPAKATWAADPVATHQAQARARRSDHPPHQRSFPHRRRNRRPLQEPLANRAPVPLDQAASRHSQVPRRQRQRHPPADSRGDDRLPVAPHRRAQPRRQYARDQIRRTRSPIPVRAARHRTIA